MHKHIIILTTFILLSLSAAAQPYGDTARARLASRHHAPRNESIQVQLGYIDTTVATAQQFIDNMEVGLRTTGNYAQGAQILEYRLTVFPKGGEYFSLVVRNSGRMPTADINRYRVGHIFRGDRIVIDLIRIKMGSDGAVLSDYPITLTII